MEVKESSTDRSTVYNYSSQAILCTDMNYVLQRILIYLEDSEYENYKKNRQLVLRLKVRYSIWTLNIVRIATDTV